MVNLRVMTSVLYIYNFNIFCYSSGQSYGFHNVLLYKQKKQLIKQGPIFINLSVDCRSSMNVIHGGFLYIFTV